LPYCPIIPRQFMTRGPTTTCLSVLHLNLTTTSRCNHRRAAAKSLRTAAAHTLSAIAQSSTSSSATAQTAALIMASLRTATAARLLRAAAPRAAPVSMAQRRYQSTSDKTLAEKPTAATSMSGSTEVANPIPAKPEDRLPNSPDYYVHTDKATSYV